MRSFVSSSSDSGRRVVALCRDRFGLSSSDVYKALKKKDIRIDGKKISSDMEVAEGQTVEVWLPDSAFGKESQPQAKKEKDYEVVYDSDRILIVNKAQGIAVHPGAGIKGSTLIDELRKDFACPDLALCHRLDMNTGGLLMCAKDKKTLEDALTLLKSDNAHKRYRALVLGVPTEGYEIRCFDGTVMNCLESYMEKAPDGRVYVHDNKTPKSQKAVTLYRVIDVYDSPAGPLSDIEVELVTGRTHQIRAQMAYIGCPVAGDGNYGKGQIMRQIKAPDGGKVRYQQLFATSLTFGKIDRSSRCSELSGRKFNADPDFAVKFTR
jgi:23S rRNA pseudouridine955/2504/2580 synthase